MIHHHNNYGLFWCFLTSQAPSMARNIAMKGPASPHSGRVPSNDWSASGHLIYCTAVGTSASSNHTYPAGSLDSLVTTNYTLATGTLAWGIWAVQ